MQNWDRIEVFVDRIEVLRIDLRFVDGLDAEFWRIGLAIRV